MAEEFSIIQGDTFYAEGLYTDENDVPVDLISGAIVVESWIRARNGDKYDLIVTNLPQTGKYSITGPTDNWPLGRVAWHVRYDSGGIKRSAEPVVINIEAD